MGVSSESRGELNPLCSHHGLLLGVGVPLGDGALGAAARIGLLAIGHAPAVAVGADRHRGDV